MYSASKAAVQTLSQSMRIDVLGKSIRVTNIQPGMTRTEFGMLRWSGDKELADKAYADIDCLYPEDVADVVAFPATRPPHVTIGGLTITPPDQISFLFTHRAK